MPLIIVAGRPCTGKTKIANQIKEHFEVENLFEEVVLVNEESLALSKVQSYSTSNHEKALRGALKSAMEHALVKPNRLVILDALNYIKGYRYEIYCTTRTARTPHCLVWVSCSENEAKERNSMRREQGRDSYDDLILEDLWKRFEAPNDANRWDNPLFRVRNSSQTNVELSSIAESAASCSTTTPPLVSTAPAAKAVKSSWKPKKKKEDTNNSSDAVDNANEILPKPESTMSALSISGTTVTYSDNLSNFVELSEIYAPMTDYLLHANLPLPNSSTVTATHAQADLLYELDRTSQRIVQMIMVHQADALEGTPLKFLEFDRVLTLNRLISPGELQRYRGQFVKVNSQHPPSTSLAVGVSFIEFLALHL